MTKQPKNALKTNMTPQATPSSETDMISTANRVSKTDMTIIWMDPRLLKPYERNPRLNDDAVEPVANSIEKFGWKQPIVADVDFVIIVGHTRWKAALHREWKQVPVLVARDLTPEQVKAYRLADNRTGEISEWDFDLLPIELSELEAMNFDMSDVGFSDAELEKLLAEHDPVTSGKTDPNAVPEPADPPVSRRGVVYQLGRHRLLCGDSTLPEDLAKLFGGDRADLYLTDPPYNVDYEGEHGLKIQNDNLKGAAFEVFLAKAFTQAGGVLQPGAAFYVFHSDNWGLSFRQAMATAGLSVRQNLVWVKNGMVMGRQDYQWQHEPCLYGWKSGAAHAFYNDRSQTTVIHLKDQPFVRREDGRYQIRAGNKFYSIAADAVCVEEVTTVLDFAKPLRSELHPTMKPVELLIYLMKNSTQRGDLVFDGFGGSGSTIIAAEQTGRRARLIELDEKYVDVIRRRWAEFVHGAECDWQAMTPELTDAE